MIHDQLPALVTAPAKEDGEEPADEGDHNHKPEHVDEPTEEVADDSQGQQDQEDSQGSASNAMSHSASVLYSVM